MDEFLRAQETCIEALLRNWQALCIRARLQSCRKTLQKGIGLQPLLSSHLSAAC